MREMFATAKHKEMYINAVFLFLLLLIFWGVVLVVLFVFNNTTLHSYGHCMFISSRYHFLDNYKSEVNHGILNTNLV